MNLNELHLFCVRLPQHQQHFTVIEDPLSQPNGVCEHSKRLGSSASAPFIVFLALSCGTMWTEAFGMAHVTSISSNTLAIA